METLEDKEVKKIRKLVKQKTNGEPVVICRYFIPPLVMVKMPDGSLELFIAG